MVQEKQQLFDELQHRIKNSFHMINNMIILHRENSADQKVINALNKIYSLTSSVSEMYNLLYTSHSIKNINLCKYLIQLVRTMPKGLHKIDFSALNDIGEIPVKTAIPIGLILTETVTNALKYAFSSNESGVISIFLSSTFDKAILKIQDNGKGFKIEEDYSKLNSLGLKLIDFLANQINGNFKIYNQKGTLCILEFPLDTKR